MSAASYFRDSSVFPGKIHHLWLGNMLFLLALFLRLFAPERAQAAKEFAGEELRSLQQAALRNAHLDERSRQSLATRLRLAPLLPQLRVSVGRGWQWGYQSAYASDAITPSSRDEDRMNYTVSASWDLSRLLFARDEVALHRDAQRVAQWRTALLLRVARLYGLRCRAQDEHAAAKSAEAQARQAERILTLDVALAALTGDEQVARKIKRCAAALATDTWDGEIKALAEGPKVAAPPAGSDGALTDDSSANDG